MPYSLQFEGRWPDEKRRMNATNFQQRCCNKCEELVNGASLVPSVGKSGALSDF
jgi:hypothetical protein